jgi:hypothetical protein
MKALIPLFSLVVSTFALAAAPPLNVSLSRSPLYQGNPYAIFVSDPNLAGHPAITILATLDGASVQLVHPQADLWVYPGSPPGLEAAHDFQISISENGALVGTQDFSFTVQHNPSDLNFPNFTAATPSLVAAAGGTSVLISGSNFTTAAQVLIGGILAQTTFIDSTKLLAVSPDLQGTTGAKTLEIDLPPLPGMVGNRNVVAAGAVFSYVAYPAGSDPVAVIANANRSVIMGTAVALDGSASYDPVGYGISFEWVFLSVPTGSTSVVGGSLGASPQVSFVPDVAGLYVVRLLAREFQGPQAMSSPQLAVIQASPAAAFSIFDTGRAFW